MSELSKTADRQEERKQEVVGESEIELSDSLNLLRSRERNNLHKCKGATFGVMVWIICSESKADNRR